MSQTGAPRTGLQADGSLAFALTGAVEGALSAPLIANMVILQHYPGANYPPTEADRLDLVRRAVYSFDKLLPACQPKYPRIKLPVAGGPPLTPEELATNFNEAARCSYYEYGAKPYWIPQLLYDVDLCARLLGRGWRLPNHVDLGRFSDADRRQLQDTLTGIAKFDPLNGSMHSWGVFYFSLKLYAHAADGTIGYGDLNPGAGDRVAPLPVSGAGLKELLIDGKGNNAALRCIRTDI
jgi:hypothetical protein